MHGDFAAISTSAEQSRWRVSPRHLSLWEILVWTYREQMAHRYLRTEYDRFMWQLAHEEIVEDMPRPSVHQDAFAIHGAVLRLDKRDREIVSFFAALADMPELPVADPRPYPMTSEKVSGEEIDEWWAWHEKPDGKRLRYLVRASDRIQVGKTPIMRKVGKRKMQCVGFKSVIQNVEFCPLYWEPDPLYIHAQIVVYQEWLDAMLRLYASLYEVKLRDHVIGTLGIDLDAEPEEIFESITGTTRNGEIERAEVELLRGKLTTLDGTRFCRVWAKARIS